MTRNKWIWILPWAGASIWLPLLALAFYFQGEQWMGISSMGFFGVFLLTAYLFRPWRWPKVSYGLLYLVNLVPLLAGAGWMIWLVKEPVQMVMFSGFAALFTPVFLLWKRRWGEDQAPTHSE